VAEQALGLVDVRPCAVERHVVNLLQVFLGGLLKLLLEPKL
jgi:hypothetical protein